MFSYYVIKGTNNYILFLCNYYRKDVIFMEKDRIDVLLKYLESGDWKRTDNIYIIGSLSQQEKIEKLGKCLMNNIDGSVRYVKKENDLSFNECISQCYDNIEWADDVIVVKKENGTIGDGVSYEMEYARRLNKKIIVI